jgi:hypothetical protein
MKLITPVFPGLERLPVTTFAVNQPEYLPLPCYRHEDGTVVTRWQLTWRERFRVMFGGSVWLSVLTFNHPLQPVKLETVPPQFGPLDVVLAEMQAPQCEEG